MEVPALTTSNSASRGGAGSGAPARGAAPAASGPAGGRPARRAFQIAGIAVVALVVLRIGVGWRFLHEGLWKYRHASYTAADFLRQARGPLAEHFHRLIPDYYGLERLDLKTMVDRWSAYRDALAAHYDFDNERHVWLFPVGTPPQQRRPGTATPPAEFASLRDPSGITFYAPDAATLQRVRGPLPSTLVAVPGVETLQHNGAWYLFTDRKQLADFRKSIESQARRPTDGTQPSEPVASAAVRRTSAVEHESASAAKDDSASAAQDESASVAQDARPSADRSSADRSSEEGSDARRGAEGVAEERGNTGDDAAGSASVAQPHDNLTDDDAGSAAGSASDSASTSASAADGWKFVTLLADGQRTAAIHAPDWYTLLGFVAAQYGLEVDVEIQSAAAQRLLDLYERQLESLLKEDQRDGQDVLRVYKPEIAQYKADVARWLEEGRQPQTREIPYLRQRHFQRWQELQRTAAPWLAAVDTMDASLRRDLAALATPQQRQQHGEYRPPKSTLEWIDWLTRYGLPVIGVCLMLGLLTRSAAMAGAVFMLLVSLSQLALPGVVPPPHPSQGHAFLISKEVLEMLALLVLAATAAGRWFGLDYIIHHAVVRPLLGTRGSDASDA